MLKQRALKATLWSGLDILLRQGLRFVVSIVLARLIAPEQFGIIALLALFIGVAQVFVDSGFSSALIQKQDTTHTDESTVFWFNLGVSVLASLALVAAAPWIAAFFGQPVLVPLTWLVAPVLVIGSLATIHHTLLTRELDFRTQLLINSTGMLISGAVAIVLALRGYGVWALAWQTLLDIAITTAMFWLLHPWRPGFVFSVASARSLFGFGGYLLGTTLLDHAFQRLYTLLIGKFFGVRELGFFNRAKGTQELPTSLLGSIVWRVALPVFSGAKKNKPQLRHGAGLAMRAMMLVNVPAMLGLAAVAQPLVLTLFGSRWLPAVPILEILCLAGLLAPMHVINVNVLMAQGHSKLFFRLQVIKQSIGIGLLLAGTLFGVLGVAWSMVVYNVLAFFINALYTGRLLGYGAWAQLRDIAPITALSFAMWGVVRGVELLWQPAPALALASGMLVGVAFMLLAVGGLRLRALREAMALFARRGKSVPQTVPAPPD